MKVRPRAGTRFSSPWIGQSYVSPKLADQMLTGMRSDGDIQDYRIIVNYDWKF